MNAQPINETEFTPGQGWPDPFDIWGKFDPPELPSGLLPTVIEDFARINAAQIGCDPAGVAMSALAVCAAAIPDRIKLKAKRHDKWAERACIWVVVVGDPSTKKSPMMNKATSPLFAIQTKQVYANNRALADWQDNGGPKSGDPKPPCPRFIIEDTTPEAAQNVLADSPNGVLARQDEMSAFFGRIEKYSGAGSGADRGFWLQAFGGGPYVVDRVSRGSIIIDNLSVTMLGGIQPGPMRKVVSAAQDDGLIQRVFPIILAPACKGQDLPAPDIDQTYADLIRSLTELKPPSDYFGEQPLEFDDDALSIREGLEDRHLDLMSLEATNPKLATHIGKYDGLFIRLCVIWHCIENASNDGLPKIVPGERAQRVADFLHGFLLKHAFAFYADMIGATDGFDDVQKLAGFILTKKLTSVTVRDIQRSGGGKSGMESMDAKAIAERMESLGWLQRGEANRSGSMVFDVNPKVHRIFAERAKDEAERREKARRAIEALAKR